jgi:hypothetical protein
VILEEEREERQRSSLRRTVQEERQRQESVNRIGSRSIREALGGYKPLD